MVVEFGLKLEDNKVSKWRDKYVRYERLKSVLDRAKKHSERLNELQSKKNKKTNPAWVASEEEEWDNNKATKGSDVPLSLSRATTTLTDHEGGIDAATIPSSPSSSAAFVRPSSSRLLLDMEERLSLLPAEASSSTESSSTTSSSSSLSPTPDETTNLRSGASSPLYAGTGPDPNNSSSAAHHLQSVDSTPVMIFRYWVRAASGVNDFWEKQHAKNIGDAIRALDDCANEFDQLIHEDVIQVNHFYVDKFNDTQGRLQLLKESVAVSFFNLPLPPPPPPLPPSPRKNDDDGDGIAALLSVQSGSDHSLYVETTPLIDPTQRKLHRDGLVAAVQNSIRKWHVHHQQQQRKEQQQRRQRHRKQKLATDYSLPVGDESLSLLPVVDQCDEEEGSVQVDDAPSASVPPSSLATNKKPSKDAVQKAREAKSVQRSLIDLYRRAKLLHNFAIMNYTGLVKIVAKHDKTFQRRKGAYADLIADVCHGGGKDVELLGEAIERLYANWFCGRSVTEARAQLLPKQGDGLEMDWSQLRLGYRMGMCSILALWVAWDCVWGTIREGASTIGERTAFPVFRACGGLLLLQWSWGCSLWVWTRYRVNFIYLFDLNPHAVSTPLRIFNEAVDNSLVFLIGMLLYYKAGANDLPIHFPAGVVPFLLVLYTFYQLLFPWRNRRSMWHAIRLVVTTPATSPTLFHAYMANISVSMVKVFQDIAWTVGFIVSGDFMIPEELTESTRHNWATTVWYSKVLIPLLTLLPLWFRFSQCLRRYADTRDRVPHLANAGKYALSMTVTLFGAVHPLYLQATAAQRGHWFQTFWMFAFVSSSLCSFFWDVRMDWGLGRLNERFLGPRLMYPSIASYYVVIGLDLVLRFAWVLTLVPPDSGAKFALPQYLTANEHRSNTSGYRRVDFVPLHFSTQHDHAYQGESPHRGGNVLAEVAVVTLLALGAAVASVVAAQYETERLVGRRIGEL